MEDGVKVILADPAGKAKTFEKDFDYAFWSHSPGEEDFVSQADVFTSLGADLLTNVWLGFNVGIFAYG